MGPSGPFKLLTMDIMTFKKEATTFVDLLPHWRNDDTEIEITTFQVGPYKASYSIYRNRNTKQVNARKRHFRINDKGLSRKAFYKAIENL